MRTKIPTLLRNTFRGQPLVIPAETSVAVVLEKTENIYAKRRHIRNSVCAFVLMSFVSTGLFLGRQKTRDTFSVQLHPEIVWRQTITAQQPNTSHRNLDITLDLNNMLRVRDLQSNRALWEKSAEDLAVTAVPVVFTTPDQRTYVAISNTDGHVFAIDALSGIETWRTHLYSDIEVSPLPLPQGLLIVACRDGKMYGLKSNSGEIHYMTAADHEITALEPVFDSISANTFYAVFADGSITAYSTQSGDSLWNQKTPGKVSDSPLVTSSRVITRTADGQLQAFDKDGNLVWIDTFNPESTVLTSADMLVIADSSSLSLVNAKDGNAVETVRFSSAIRDIQFDQNTGQLHIPLENNTIYRRDLGIGSESF
jgi:hypothetical protein